MVKWKTIVQTNSEKHIFLFMILKKEVFDQIFQINKTKVKNSYLL